MPWDDTGDGWKPPPDDPHGYIALARFLRHLQHGVAFSLIGAVVALLIVELT